MKDGHENVCIGQRIELHDTNRCIVHTQQEKRVIIQGLDGFIVAEKDNTLLICRRDEEGNLIGIDETKDIVKNGDGAAVQTDNGMVEVDPESLVSMNMWGFSQSFVKELEKGFPEFLKTIEGNELKAEYLLPIIVDDMLSNGRAVVKVLRTDDQWFGVTYKEDKAFVKESFEKLVNAGVYKSPLF